MVLRVKPVQRYDRECIHEQLVIHRGKITVLVLLARQGTLLRHQSTGESGQRRDYYFGRSNSHNAKDSLDLRRQMTLVFQKTILFRTTVFENIAYGLKVRGFKKQEIKKRVDTLLEQVGLKELAGRHAATLSGGEAQRVALARRWLANLPCA